MATSKVADRNDEGNSFWATGSNGRQKGGSSIWIIAQLVREAAIVHIGIGGISFGQTENRSQQLKENENTAPATVSVIIPVYNEAETIQDLVQGIKSLYPDFEIIVVNDGSTDETSEAAARAGARVLTHPYNIGNGAAIKTGIRHATGDILVFMDGDGQHKPEDIRTMLSYFPAYDMVVGQRTREGQASVGRSFANTVYNWLATYVAKVAVKDLTSGFRAVKADIAKSFIYLLPNTYSYPTTMTLGVLRAGHSVKYIPIQIQKRKMGKSNIRLFSDGVRFFMIIFKICTLYSPLRMFLPVSAFFFMTGFLYYIYTFLTDHRFTNMSALLFSTSIIIFMMGLISEQICQMRFERRAGSRTPVVRKPRAGGS
ncbi:MAG: glycosyltransferase family 2 protein [Desulfobacteraceae bacterium]|nr:MAG: glycosyltransferase family 2 protein [Desulfobacteraceae bacterium]